MLLKVRHANGVESWYAHLSTIAVEPGNLRVGRDRGRRRTPAGSPSSPRPSWRPGSRHDLAWSAVVKCNDRIIRAQQRARAAAVEAARNGRNGKRKGR